MAEVMNAAHRRTSSFKRQISSWVPPSVGFFKLNVDGGVDTTDGCHGIGEIVRGSNGDFVGVMSIPAPSLISVLVLELHAIKKGLKLAMDLGCVRLIVESDSLSVNQVVVNHVSRDANGTAHRLAQFSLQCRELSMWVDTGPSWLMDLVHVESVMEV
ncbi:hypothetical protein ACFX2K_014269 [Malus domestica]